MFANLRSGDAAARAAALDILSRRYWRPAFVFLRRSGCDEESAKDLVQSLFADWVRKDVFAQVDRNKGRFRTFMLCCLKRLVSNEHRAEVAQKRAPSEGILSLDELMDSSEERWEPAAGIAPDAAFDKVWAVDVIERVVQQLRQECSAGEKRGHFDIFARRIINPILQGLPAPSMAVLAQEHDLSEKQAANCLLTARRAYQRLLKEEVRLYASSETEVASEVRELFLILGQ